MPLFSRHAEPAHQPAPQPEPVYEERPKRHGLFGSRHHSPTRAPTKASNSTRSSATSLERERDRSSGGIFRRSTDASNNTSHRGSLLHRTFGNGNVTEMDPSIVQARERLMSAEQAEQAADRALHAARESVREAREHVRRLELEAEEEARRAKIKQQHAREFSKRGNKLGRFDY